jgi:perosamine synthetase
MDPLADIARSHNLFIIEDAAEAHGAGYKGRKVGSLSDISCFSFYGNKVITTGEGGMCLTDDKRLAEKMKMLRDHAMNPEKRYWHDEIGYNYRMTNLQAALGVSQLKKIDTFIEKKREIARWYASGLSELENKGLVTLPIEMAWARNIYWMYSILIHDTFGLSRDELIMKLDEKDIETRPLFYPIHTMPMYRTGQSFPVADLLSRTGISLPSSVKLTTEQVAYITETIKGQVR